MSKKVFGVWPIPFLNMLTALKGSQFYFFVIYAVGVVP